MTCGSGDIKNIGVKILIGDKGGKHSVYKSQTGDCTCQRFGGNFSLKVFKNKL